jgi:hypothetical protein
MAWLSWTPQWNFGAFRFWTSSSAHMIISIIETKESSFLCHCHHIIEGRLRASILLSDLSHVNKDLSVAWTDWIVESQCIGLIIILVWQLCSFISVP